MLKMRLAFFLVASAIWAESPSPIRQMLAENRLDEALPLCRQYEVLSASDADNFLACAWVYFRTERVDAADKLLERAKKGINPLEMQMLQAYGFVARGVLPAAERAALDDAGKRKYEDTLRLRLDEAQRRLEPIISKNRGTVVGRQAQELSAEFYEMKGQLDTAAFIYRGLVNEEPMNGRVNWGLGRYYAARGDETRAINHLETTAKVWPKHLPSRFQLGMIYLNQGERSFRESARWFSEAYKLDRADAGTLEQIGVLFERKDRLADALRYWQRALQINPNAAVAKQKTSTYFVQILDGLVAQKKYAEALQKIETASPAVRNEPSFRLKKGIILRNLGQYAKASAELKTYLEQNPDDAVANRELGICYLNDKKFELATKQFARALELDGKDGLNHAWMAYVYESRRQLPEALEAWKKASELLKDPEDLERAAVKISKLEKKSKKKLKPASVEEREVASEPDTSEMEFLE